MIVEEDPDVDVLKILGKAQKKNRMWKGTSLVDGCTLRYKNVICQQGTQF
jgi:hypothetical protein